MTVDEYMDRFAEVLPEGHKPKDAERRHAQELVDGIAANGGLFQLDQMGMPAMGRGNQPRPIEYAIVRGMRFCVDPQGRVWRFIRHGMPRNPLNPERGGSPRRNNAVEMWTGRWYKRLLEHPDGSKEYAYAKATHWVVLDRNVNRPRENLSAIDHYTHDKGYRHPFDPPHKPSHREVAAMERKSTMTSAVVLAQMGALAASEGLDAKVLHDRERAVSPTPVTLEQMSYPALQQKAKAMGIPGNQKKPQLIEAIRAAGN